MSSLFIELKRRNVFRVALVYIVAAWLLLQVADVVLNNIEAPNWVFQTILLHLERKFLLYMQPEQAAQSLAQGGACRGG